MRNEGTQQTVCIVASEGRSLINFRGPLIKSWVDLGFKVVCVSVESPEDMVPEIEKLGASYVQVYGSRTGIGLRDGIQMMKGYVRTFKEISPDYIFLYMSKPLAFGSWAANKTRIPHVNVLVNGLENAFYRSTIKDALIRFVLTFFYHFISNKAENVFFQNPDDCLLLEKRRVFFGSNACIVNGSGVDMNFFERKPLPDTPVILMVARLLWSKGIREFLQAVPIVKKAHPETKVLLVGGLDSNDEAISKIDLELAVKKYDIEYCGHADDVRPFLARCSIFVLPSYHEGLPRSVLEAMAVGRPIITTDVSGCRETVIDGINGFLVPPKDGEALAEKLIRLIEDSSLCNKMAEESYQICKKKFEVSLINKLINAKMFGIDE